MKVRATLSASALATLALVLAACGSTDAGGEAASATTLEPIPIGEFTTTTPATPAVPAGYEDYRAQATACDADQPPPIEVMEFEAPEDQQLDANPTTVVLATSCGEIVIEMDPASAPETVNSFVFLANAGFFDGGASHRIVPGYIIQAGDPTATGIGGPGYVIPDEYPPNGFVYERGVVAMGNAGPGTTGSQFFIMVGDSGLPPTFSVVGRVVEGLDVVDRIAALPLGFSPRGEQSVPLETLYLERVTVAP